MPHAALINTFYTAFQAKDGEAMAACYHPEVRFSDPVFPNLEGARAGGMWRMLCGQAADLEIKFSGVEVQGDTGRAHWEAWYTFSLTGHKVHNIIEAEFSFKDGKIIRHKDRFDFWRWSRQALGVKGVLLGWTPIVRNAVRAQADKNLGRFMAS